MTAKQEFLNGLEEGDFVIVSRVSSFTDNTAQDRIAIVKRVTKRTIEVGIPRLNGDGVSRYIGTAKFSAVHGYRPGERFYGDYLRPFSVEAAVGIMEAVERKNAATYLREGWTKDEAVELAKALKAIRAKAKGFPTGDN